MKLEQVQEGEWQAHEALVYNPRADLIYTPFLDA
jgi:hypothetical protein